MGKFQSVNQRAEPDRAFHVWRRREDGRWQCVLCGGVTRTPTNEELPEAFEALDDGQRALCPPRHGRSRR